MPIVLNEKDRRRIVAQLISNKSFSAKEEEALDGLSDNALLRLQEGEQCIAVVNAIREAFAVPPEASLAELPSYIANAAAMEDEEEDPEDEEEEVIPVDDSTKEDETVENEKGKNGKKPEEKPTCNQQKPLTDQEWLETAPPTIRSAVQNAMAIEAEQKQQLIAQLTANLNKDQQVIVANRLKDKPLAELKDLALLAPKAATPPATLNFAGQAGAYTPPVSNGKKLEPLPLPDHDLAVANAAKS